MYQPGQWLAIRRSAIEGVVVDQTESEVTLAVFSPSDTSTRRGNVELHYDPDGGGLQLTELWTLPAGDVFALADGEPPHQPDDIDTLLTEEEAAGLVRTAFSAYEQQRRRIAGST
jgi:hypothetical protein